MTDYLARLNAEQRAAVETVDGPLLVLAGAGTGKTRVLTTRFAHILLTGRASPGQVLAVTFTNKAAREMRERVGAILGRPVEGLWLGTFHALCARMLRRHADRVGLTSSFTILDADDQLRLLKQVMEAERVDAKRWVPPALMAVIQRWKDRGLTPARITPAEDTDFAGGRARELYAAYQARLRSLNTADFGDLLLHMTEVLREHPDVLAQYHRMFRYILVDEYQDTNLVQYLWLRLLAQGHRNICCVGDDDQSIYSWRGAEVENILRFEKDFEGARIVRLEANYRSTAPILAAASGLIAHNEGRLGKTLRSGRQDATGEKVTVVSLWDSDEEARMVGDRIEALRRDGDPLAEMAILVRAGFQTRAFEERLITLGLPYRVVGGLRGGHSGMPNPLPLPVLYGERVGVRGCLRERGWWRLPLTRIALQSDLSPQAGRGEGRRRLRQQPQPQILRDVGVLILIHQNELEAVLVVSEHVGVLAEQPDVFEQEIAEIGGVEDLQPLLIGRIELAALAIAEHRGFARRHLRRRQPAIFPAVNQAGQHPRRPALVVDVVGGQ